MPIHDWSQVEAGIFHAFHQTWIIDLYTALNDGVLPEGFFALPDQMVDGPIPDIVTLQRRTSGDQETKSEGGLAVAIAPPKARIITSASADRYAWKADRVVIKHQLGDVVAVIGIVSPGNKSSVHGLRSFVIKAEELLRRGVSLLVIDLLPPTPRDPQGIHKAIWDEIKEEPFSPPEGNSLTAVAYDANPPITAYVEPLSVGDALPSLPIFLEWGTYVPAPLEDTYQKAWAKLPRAAREFVENLQR